jgi:hypothetical protein
MRRRLFASSILLAAVSFAVPAAATKPTLADTIGTHGIYEDAEGFTAVWTYAPAKGDGPSLRAQRFDRQGRPVGGRVVRALGGTPPSKVVRVGGAFVTVTPTRETSSMLTMLDVADLAPAGISRELPDAVVAVVAGPAGGVNVVTRPREGALAFMQLGADLGDRAAPVTVSASKELGILAGDQEHWITVEQRFLAPSGLARRILVSRRAPDGTTVGAETEAYVGTDDDAVFAVLGLPRRGGDLVVIPENKYAGGLGFAPPELHTRFLLPDGRLEPRASMGRFAGDARSMSLVDRGDEIVATFVEPSGLESRGLLRRYGASDVALRSEIAFALPDAGGISAVACNEEGCAVLAASALEHHEISVLFVDGKTATPGIVLDQTPRLADDGHACSAAPIAASPRPSFVALALAAVANLAILRRRGKPRRHG